LASEKWKKILPPINFGLQKNRPCARFPPMQNKMLIVLGVLVLVWILLMVLGVIDPIWTMF